MYARWLALLIIANVAALSTRAQDGVILLHGLCRTNASMEKMARALAGAGFVVVNVDYPSRTARVDELGNATIGTALQNPALKNCPKIHFVTHSLGGILVRSYFKQHAEPRLGRVVMLGPPNQGSEVVDKLGAWKLFKRLNGPAGGELGTLPDAVPQQLGPVNFELGVIAGDRSINWINSAMIAGTDDGKVSVARTKIDGMKAHLVIHASHPFLMKNKTAIAQTIYFLQTGTFAPSDR